MHRVTPHIKYTTVRRNSAPNEIRVDKGRIATSKDGKDMYLLIGEPVFGYSDGEGNFDIYHELQIIGRVQ